MTPARADVKLPKIFGDNMVLQQQVEAAVWGWADANEEVTISLGDAKATTKAGADGKWMAKIKTPAADGKPLEPTVKGKNEIRLTDVRLATSKIDHLCAEVEELRNTRRRCHALLQGAMSALPPNYPEAPEVWAELEDCAEHACTRQCDEEREPLVARLTEAEGLLLRWRDRDGRGCQCDGPDYRCADCDTREYLNVHRPRRENP